MLGFDVTQVDIQLDPLAHITSLGDQNVQSDAETFFECLLKTVIRKALMINALTSHPEVGKDGTLNLWPKPCDRTRRE